MFNMSRLTETLTDLVGSWGGEASARAMSAIDLLHNAGLDPSALTGLSESEVIALLSENGIDPSQFLGGQLDELMNGLGLQEHFSVASSGKADPVSEASDTQAGS